MRKFKETSLAVSQNQWPEAGQEVVQYSMEYYKKDGKISDVEELGKLAFKCQPELHVF